MESVSLDALTRRASLMALGAAGLAGLANSNIAGAKKRKKKGDVNKLCKKQVGQCTTLLTAACGDQPTCPALVACCSSFGTCNATEFITCFNAAVAD